MKKLPNTTYIFILLPPVRFKLETIFFSEVSELLKFSSRVIVMVVWSVFHPMVDTYACQSTLTPLSTNSHRSCTGTTGPAKNLRTTCTCTHTRTDPHSGPAVDCLTHADHYAALWSHLTRRPVPKLTCVTVGLQHDSYCSFPSQRMSYIRFLI
jgi:hypothetical protein